MQILRKFLVWLAALALPTALFGFGLLLSLNVVVGRPAPVKSAVDNSGLYSVLVDSALAQNKVTIGDIPLNDPEIKKIISGNFTPSLLQQSGDHIIDGTYGWLQGKTSSPQFNVNLTGTRNQTAQDIATYVTLKVSKLPVCSASQSYAALASLSSANVYNLSCRPSVLNLITVHDQIYSAIIGSGQFLDQAKVTATSVKDSNGKPLYQQLHMLPTAYQWTVKGTYILGILAALAAAAIVFLSLSRRGGLRHVSITFLSVGAISAALALVSAYATGKIQDFVTKSWGADQALQIQVKISDIVHALTLDVRHWWLSISIVELVLGLTGLITLFITRPKNLAMATIAQNVPTMGGEQNNEASENLTNNNFPNSGPKQKPGA